MKSILKFFHKVQIGFYHASYHRNLKRAQEARIKHDIIQFKNYIYRAEDAWRKVVILTEKSK